jgi:hypothetical protein
MAAVKKPRPLTDEEHRVLALIEHRAMILGSIQSYADLSRAQATRVLGGLIARGLVDEDRGWYFRKVA